MESTTAGHARVCKATRKDGSPCGALCVTGSDYCFMHDPALAKERKEARSKGGRARHGRQLGKTAGGYIEINELGDVVGVLEHELNEVLQLDRSISRARAVGYLASVLASVYKDTEIETRIAALEAAAGTKH